MPTVRRPSSPAPRPATRRARRRCPLRARPARSVPVPPAAPPPIRAAAVESSEHGARGMVVQKSLTHTQRSELEAQMTAARSVAEKYPTVKDAEAAGYFRSTPYVPCIGAHYTNFGLVGTFDPAAPSELLYDGTTPDVQDRRAQLPRVQHPGGRRADSPVRTTTGTSTTPTADSASAVRVWSGAKRSRARSAQRAAATRRCSQNIWMVHAWVVPGFECTWGTFSGECPELGGRLCGNAWESPLPPTKPDTCPTAKSS